MSTIMLEKTLNRLLFQNILLLDITTLSLTLVSVLTMKSSWPHLGTTLWDFGVLLMDLSNRLSSDHRRTLILVVFLLILKSFTLLDLTSRLLFGILLDNLKLNLLIQLIPMLLANLKFLQTQRTIISSLLDGMDLLKSGKFLDNVLPLLELMTVQSML